MIEMSLPTTNLDLFLLKTEIREAVRVPYSNKYFTNLCLVYFSG